MMDPSSGLFAFDRPRALDEAREFADEGLGKVLNPDDRTILTQLWAPADYITASFGRGDLDDPHLAYVMAWTFGKDGRETELGLGEDDWDLQNAAVDEVFRSADGETESRYIQDANDDSVTVYQEAERGLLALRRFPPATPEIVRDELASRQASRLAGIKDVLAALEEANEKGNIWLRLFGGDAIAGEMAGVENGQVIVRRARPRQADKDKYPWRVRIGEIAFARPFSGKWRRPPETLTGLLFERFNEEAPASAAIAPQLWTAACPTCEMAVRLPWSTDSCRSCREGQVRNPYSVLSDSRLEGLLESRAEWLKLNVEIVEDASGKWRAAFKTENGDYVKGTFLGETMAVLQDSRRQALIDLNLLSEEHGFSITADLEGYAEWEPVKELPVM
jgi:hypothetical protein